MTTTIDLSELPPRQKLLRLDALVTEYILGWQWIGCDFADVATLEHQFWLLPDAGEVRQLTPGKWTWYEEDAQGQPVGTRLLALNLLPRLSQNLNEAYAIAADTFDSVLMKTRKIGGIVEKQVSVHTNNKYHAEVTSYWSMERTLCLAMLQAYDTDVIL